MKNKLVTKNQKSPEEIFESRELRIKGKKKSYNLSSHSWGAFDYYTHLLGLSRDSLMERLEFYFDLLRRGKRELIFTDEYRELNISYMISEMQYAEDMGRSEQLLKHYKIINNYYEDDFRSQTPNIIATELAEGKPHKISLNLSVSSKEDSNDPLLQFYLFAKREGMDIPLLVKVVYILFCVGNRLIKMEEATSDKFDKEQVYKRFLVKSNYKSFRWSPNLFIQIAMLSEDGRNLSFLSISKNREFKKNPVTINFSLKNNVGIIIMETLPILSYRFDRSPSAILKMILMEGFYQLGIVNSDYDLCKGWQDKLVNLNESSATSYYRHK